MKLYYSPGACSLSPHIALREIGMAFEMDEVDLKSKKTKGGENYLSINPNGYVPALKLEDGQILTEAAVVVQYIADQRPDVALAPPAGTLARYRLQEWLHFIGTELHKGMSPLYNAKANEEYRTSLKERLHKRLGHLAKAVAERPFVMGDTFTVVDGYAFYVLRAWQKQTKTDLSPWPPLAGYYKELSGRPSVQKALEVEGISANVLG